MMTGYLKLFASCIKTKGAKRSLIADLQRGHTYAISNDLYDFLNDCESKDIQEVLQSYDPESQKILSDNILHLVRQELAFTTDIPNSFPKVDNCFEDPYLVDNCIIDRNEISEYNIFDAINKISETNCNHYQFRFFSDVMADFILDLLRFTDKNEIIKTVEIVVKYSGFMLDEFLGRLPLDFPKIKNLIIFQAPHDKIVQSTGEIERAKMGNVIMITETIKDDSHCGIINPFYAVYNNSLRKYLESQQSNSCLSRKIGIDVNGNIKNCPSMTATFGKVSDISNIVPLVMSKEFKAASSIIKDNINICKDCEFRHICSDCRAFTDNQDIFNKPLKCNYDPYTNIWN